MNELNEIEQISIFKCLANEWSSYLHSLRRRGRPSIDLEEKIRLVDEFLIALEDELNVRNHLQQLRANRSRGRPTNEYLNQINETEQELNVLIDRKNQLFDRFENLNVNITDFPVLHEDEQLNVDNQVADEEMNEADPQLDERRDLDQETDDFFQIFKSTLDESKRMSHEFETKQKNLVIKHCLICEEMNLQMISDICDSCAKYPDPATLNLDDPEDVRRLNPLSSFNNMHPGEIPECLTGLTVLEQTLISQIKPFIHVFRSSRGQLGYSKQVISFNQNIQEIVSELPHALSTLSTHIIFRKESTTPDQFSEIRVRREKVRNALEYLIHNNRYYQGTVEINHRNLDELPEDASVEDYLTVVFEPEENHASSNSSNLHNQDSNLDSPNQSSAMSISDLDSSNQSSSTSATDLDSSNQPNSNQEDPQIDLVTHSSVFNFDLPVMRERINQALDQDNATPVLNFPRLEPQPINELTPGLIARIFPCLFPTGIADLNDERLIKVTNNQWFKHMMKLKGGHFAKDERFRYFGSNYILRHQALQKGRIFVEKNSEFANMSVEQIKEALVNNPLLYRKILSFGSNLRSTPPFWWKCRNEVKDMVEQLKAPTFFFTLSAADLQWPELYRLLDPENNYPSFENESAENRRRSKLLNENPLIVAWFFNLRDKFFVEEVLFPHFVVLDWWFRIEFQHRGSPHIHGFLWLDNAPSITNIETMSDEELQMVADYFGDLVSATNIPIEISENRINPCKIHFNDVETHPMYSQFHSNNEKHIADYSNLITTVQRHTRCSDSCLRKLRNSNVRSCRYKFPKTTSDVNKIVRNEDGHLELVVKRNDARLNLHIPLFSVLWRGNTDYTPIISYNVVGNYLTKYASKDESTSNGLRDIVEIVNSVRTTENTRSFIQSLLLKQCAMRDYSAQECIWILMGFDFYSSSRKFVTINISPNAFIQISNDDDEATTVIRDPENSYSTRLNDFQIQRLRGRPPANADEINQQRLEAARNEVEQMCMFEFFSTYYKRGNQPWSRHTKKPILRVFPRPKLVPNSNNENNDQYFKHKLKLYVPWQNNFEQSINPNNLPWSEVYRNYSQQIPDFVDLDDWLNNEDDEFEIEENEDHQFQDLNDWMIYMRLRPNDEQLQQAELGLREQDTTFDWTASYNNYENHNELMNFTSNLAAQFQQNEAEPVMPNVQFSNEQTRVLEVIQAQIHFLRTNVQLENFRQSIIIQGKAGSGKTTLIQAIKAILYHELGRESYCVMAPTGTSASLLNARTIHSKLKINVDSIMRPLQPQILNVLQDELSGCFFVIIDEMSLIGCSLLRKIDLRLREIKGVDRNFGGCFLILLGDLKQLPPVLDRPLYGSGFNNLYSPAGQQLFRSIDSSINLPTSFRQAEDQRSFREMLDRLSDGATTVDDWRLINSRCITRLQNPEQFNNCLRLFDTNCKVHELNDEKLRQFDHVYRVLSINNCRQAEKADSKTAENLEYVLYLAIGCRVMLRRNISTVFGLVNGSIRTVTDIVVQPNSDNMPLFVMIEFDNYTGPTINASVPIVPVQTSWTSDNIDCTRYQLPISVAYGVTIHKAQGIELDHVICSIGESERTLGLAYVAFSRVRTLDGLALDKPYDLSRFTNISKSKLFSQRQNEERRLRTISLL